MEIDLTKIQPWQVAAFTALGALAAGIVGACAAVGVAFVNAVAAHRLAKVNAAAALRLANQNARRDYYLKVLTACMDRFEADAPRLIELSQMCSRIRAAARAADDSPKLFASTAEHDYNRAKAITGELFYFPKIFSDTNVQLQSVLRQDEAVEIAYMELIAARWELDAEVSMILSKEHSLIVETSPVRDHVNRTIEAIVRLRIAMENFVYRDLSSNPVLAEQPR